MKIFIRRYKLECGIQIQVERWTLLPQLVHFVILADGSKGRGFLHEPAPADCFVREAGGAKPRMADFNQATLRNGRSLPRFGKSL